MDEGELVPFPQEMKNISDNVEKKSLVLSLREHNSDVTQVMKFVLSV